MITNQGWWEARSQQSLEVRATTASDSRRVILSTVWTVHVCTQLPHQWLHTPTSTHDTHTITTSMTALTYFNTWYTHNYHINDCTHLLQHMIHTQLPHQWLHTSTSTHDTHTITTSMTAHTYFNTWYTQLPHQWLHTSTSTHDTHASLSWIYWQMQLRVKHHATVTTTLCNTSVWATALSEWALALVWPWLKVTSNYNWQ